MRLNLKDITFLFLVKIDTIERVENLLVSTQYLIDNFDTNIEVLEINAYQNGILRSLLKEEIKYSFIEDMDPILHRTRYLNYMMGLTKTPFVAVWDVDVITHKEQIWETAEILRSRKAEFVYPYESQLLDTSFVLRKLFLKHHDIEVLNKNKTRMKEMYPPIAVGGAFFCDLEAYTKLGLENEEFYGWGVEDGERFRRWKNSSYKTERVKGPLYHLSHPRGINSLIHQYDQSFLKHRILETSERKARMANLKTDQ